MNGQLSPAFGRLYRLKRLDLGGAVGLTGSIEALRNATLLQELNLSHCQVPWYDVAVSNRVFLLYGQLKHVTTSSMLCHVMILEIDILRLIFLFRHNLTSNIIQFQ